MRRGYVEIRWLSRKSHGAGFVHMFYDNCNDNETVNKFSPCKDRGFDIDLTVIMIFLSRIIRTRTWRQLLLWHSSETAPLVLRLVVTHNINISIQYPKDIESENLGLNCCLAVPTKKKQTKRKREKKRKKMIMMNGKPCITSRVFDVNINTT